MAAKKYLKNYHEGGIDGFIAFILSLVFLVAIIIYAVDLDGDILQSNQINEVMRRYVLIMEGNGCLTLSEQQALIYELENLGVRNIVFASDPKQKVAYGSEVILSITAEVDALQITGMDGFKLIRNKDGITFEKTLKSTAQY